MVLNLIDSLFPVGNEICRYFKIFGVDASSSTKIHNRKKDLLIFGKGRPTQELEHTLSAEKNYSINFTKITKYFV